MNIKLSEAEIDVFSVSKGYKCFRLSTTQTVEVACQGFGEARSPLF